MERRVLLSFCDDEFYGMPLLHVPRTLKHIMKKKIWTKSELAKDSGLLYSQASREAEELEEKGVIAMIPADVIRKSELGKIVDIDPLRGRKSKEVIIWPWIITLDTQLVEGIEKAIYESDLPEEDKQANLRKLDRIKQLWNEVKAPLEG